MTKRLFVLLLLALSSPAAAQDDAEVASEDTDPAVERVAEMAPRSMAVVHCGDLRAGTAFAFGEAGRLATVRHVAECPRSLSVETLDGRRAEARVLTMGEDHDLAVLIVDDDLGLEPLGARDTGARTGLEVYALGFPAVEDDEGHVTLTATRGVVGQVQDDVVYSDVTVSPGSSGGPLVDAQLRLVGVVYASNLTGVTLAVPSAHLVPVARYADDGGDARFPLTFHGGLSLGVVADREGALLGARAEVGLALFDAWRLRLGFGAYGGTEQELTPAPSSLERSLYQGTAELGYRFRFELGEGASLTLEPTIGVAIGRTDTVATTYAIGLADPGCDPSLAQCAITTTESITESERWHVRPTVGLRLGVVDFLHVGYQLQLDVEEPEASTHLVTFGFEF